MSSMPIRRIPDIWSERWSVSSTLIGKLSRLAANPLIFIPMILVPLALILICNVVSTVSLAGKIAKEEEEEAVREAIREIREKKGNKGKE